jgi:hypothetical protein
VREQRLDRGIVAEGEDRVALGAVVEAAQVEFGVDRLDDLLAADVFVEDVGIRGGAGAAILESQHERETRDHKSRFRLFTSIAAQFAGFEKGERAIQIAEGIKDEGERTSALSQVAAILTYRNEDEQARQAFRTINEDGDRVFALIGMSDAKEKNEDRAAALDLLNEAAELAETVPQMTFRAGAYNEIGKRLAGYGETEASHRAFASAVSVIGQIRDESAVVTSLITLAYAGADLDVADPTRETVRSLLIKHAGL